MADVLYELQRPGDKYNMNRKDGRCFIWIEKAWRQKFNKQKRMDNKLETSIIWTEKDGT